MDFDFDQFSIYKLIIVGDPGQKYLVHAMCDCAESAGSALPTGGAGLFFV